VDLSPDPLRSIASGYRTLLKRIGTVLAFAATTVALSAAIVYPLWYLASLHKSIFDILVITAAAGGLIVVLVRRIVRKPANGVTRRKIALGFVKKLGAAIAVVAAVYAIVLLVLAGKTAIAIPVAVVFLGVFGYLVYGKR
jgi:hypothetical protein